MFGIKHLNLLGGRPAKPRLLASVSLESSYFGPAEICRSDETDGDRISTPIAAADGTIASAFTKAV